MASTSGKGSGGSRGAVSRYFPPSSPYTKLASREKATGTVPEKVAPSGSGKRVLSSANRFPLSSTPTVSPRRDVSGRKENSGRRHQECKENLKKITISASSCSGMSSTAKEDMDGRGSLLLRSPVLAGARWTGEESKPEERGQMSIGPLTTGASGTTLFGSQVFCSTMLQQAEDNHNQYEELGSSFKMLNPLKILHQNIDILKQLLLCKFAEMEVNGENQRQRQGGLSSAPEASVSYEFEYGCFTGVFPEAHNHAFHLLFQCYDLMESEKRFRNVWPLEDKKTESSFRKVVSIWLKEIIPANHRFFRNFKIDNLGGILVNSATDRRFVQLIIAFTNFVLYCTVKNFTKADGDRADNLKLLERPKTFSDIRITSAQLLGTTAHLERLRKLTAQLMKEELLSQMQTETLMMEFQKRKSEYDQRLQDLRQRSDPDLVKLVDEISYKTNTSTGGSVMDLDLSKCENLPILGRIIPLLSKNLVGEIVRVHSILSEMFQRQQGKLPALTQTPYELESFFDRYKTVWSILSCSKRNAFVLPVAQLYMGNNQTEPSTLIKFVHCIENSLRNFVSDEQLMLPISKDLLQKFKHLEVNCNCSKFQLEDIETRFMDTLSTTTTPTLTTPPFAEDWTVLSRLIIPTLKSRLSFSTNRRINCLPMSTGQTPKIVNFLHSNNLGSRRQSTGPGKILCSLPPVLSKTPQTSTSEASFQCSPSIAIVRENNFIKTPSRFSVEKRHSLQGLWQDEKGIMDTSCSGLFLDDGDESE